MSFAQPLAGETGVQAVYQAALDAGRFEIQRCASCGRHQFFPRELCSHCGAADLAWVTPAGRGAVYATTVVRRKPEAGGDLNVALIELDEGVRLMSRVEGIPPTDVRIGMKVKARVEVTEGRGLMVFEPLGGQQ